MGCLSSAGPEILAFGSYCSANFQPILDYFIPSFKLNYKDSHSIKADCVNTVVFNLRQIKQRNFLGHLVYQVTSEKVYVGWQILIIKSFLRIFEKSHIILNFNLTYLVCWKSYRFSDLEFCWTV